MVKRAIDLAVAAAALVVLSPVMALTALVIAVKLGRPVLFRQVRQGRHGAPFEMVKFRTMSDARGAGGELLPDAERIGPLGRFLRATSLDELPELINILKGEMSLVGPRPLLMEYIPLYAPHQARRMAVVPGLTGLAQVSGRNALSWDEKFALDVEYVERQSLWLDLKILFQTAGKVLGRSGISAAGEATMPRFTGSSEPRRGN